MKKITMASKEKEQVMGLFLFTKMVKCGRCWLTSQQPFPIPFSVLRILMWSGIIFRNSDPSHSPRDEYRQMILISLPSVSDWFKGECVIFFQPVSCERKSA